MTQLPIALDGFGSDDRPGPEVEAAVLAAGRGIDVELVGDPARLEPVIAELVSRVGDAGVDDHLKIVAASEEIAMGESPARAVRGKPDASLVVTVDRVKSGRAAAAVSAGNSGALLAAGLLRLGRIPGVDRPAILTSFPRVDGGGGEFASRNSAGEVGKLDRTVLLDAGANVECRPLNLVQFAVMGAVHARVEQGRERPTVAVLANGSEAGKGTALTQAACEVLEGGPSELFEFVGLAEPAELFASRCDVVVTDGWTGNLMLKLGERAMTACFDLLRESLRGASQSAEIEEALAATQSRVDPELHGGAPLFGVDGTLIICHGASTPRALLNALTHARRFADRGLHSALTEALASHQALFDSARAKR